MATQTIVLYKNDLLPKLQVQLWDSTGAYVDLTNVDSVKLVVGESAADLIIDNKLLVITNAKQGLCHYFWELGDTATPGEYTAEVYLTYAGKVQTAVVFTLIILDSLR